MSLHDYSARTIDGTDKSLGDFKGKTLLVVNVASKCGMTPHYKGLQALYEEYGDRNFEVLGFPCNQFGGQEPGTEEEIASFCEKNFGVTFPLFAKIDVNGDGRAPVYGFLTSQATEPEGSGDIRWNFTKFVVGPDGEVVARFSPPTTPDDPDLVGAIERTLG